MKPPVEAPTSRHDQPGRVDLERVERGRELVAAAADVRVAAAATATGVSAASRSPGLRSRARRVALPHPDLAGQDERLGPAARLDQPALDEQLVEPDACRRLARSMRGSPAYRGTARFTRTHRRSQPLTVVRCSGTR